MNLLQVKNLSVQYGAKSVLRDVSFEISEAEIVTIVGPNGSGKTTLLRALIGAVPVTGHVIKAQGLKVGYVPQKMTLDGSLPLSVERFLKLQGGVAKAQFDRVSDLAGIATFHTQDISTLSGGQLQRVLLARALMANPQLLILDEPTQGLDQAGSAAFYKQIAELRDQLNCAVLMVSHELHVVMAASDRVICLNGHICCQGAPAQVASAPEYRALFGAGTQGALALYRHEHDHAH